MEHSTDSKGGKQRLQKLLARAGFGSRRECEELIVDGRVTVNDAVVSVLGAQADPSRDVITVDGERIHMPKPIYWIVNKPQSVALDDLKADPGLLGPNSAQAGRLFTVGRLEKSARGLLVLTNDGRVANVLSHPRYRVPKVYEITIKDRIERTAISLIERAIFYATNHGRCERISVLRSVAGRTKLRLATYEALPQSLRDIFLKFDHPIQTIERVRIGPIEPVALAAGRAEKMTEAQQKVLLEYVEKAESGAIEYEGEMISPATFDRNARAPEFKPKPQGARNASRGGQKRISAGVNRPARATDGRTGAGDRSSYKGARSPAGRRPGGSGPSARGTSRGRPEGSGTDTRGRGKPSAAGPRGYGKPSSGGSRTSAPGGRGKPSSGGSRTSAPGGRSKPSSGGSRTSGPGGRGKPSSGGSRTSGPGGRGKPSSGGSRTAAPRGRGKPSAGGSRTAAPRGRGKPSAGGSRTAAPRGRGKPSTGGSRNDAPRGRGKPGAERSSSPRGRGKPSTGGGRRPPGRGGAGFGRNRG